MTEHLDIPRIRHAVRLLWWMNEERLRPRPDTAEDDDPGREYFSFIEEIGTDAAQELLALSYWGRDGGDRSEFERLKAVVRSNFPDGASAGSQLSEKPGWHLAVGLARLAGLPEGPETTESDES